MVGLPSPAPKTGEPRRRPPPERRNANGRRSRLATGSLDHPLSRAPPSIGQGHRFSPAKMVRLRWQLRNWGVSAARLRREGTLTVGGLGWPLVGSVILCPEPHRPLAKATDFRRREWSASVGSSGTGESAARLRRRNANHTGLGRSLVPSVISRPSLTSPLDEARFTPPMAESVRGCLRTRPGHRLSRFSAFPQGRGRLLRSYYSLELSKKQLGRAQA